VESSGRKFNNDQVMALTSYTQQSQGTEQYMITDPNT